MFVKGFVAACGVMLPFAAFGQVVWDQEPSADGLGQYSDGISTNGTQFAPPQAVADDFSLSAAANISDIQFWGSSEDAFAPDLSNFKAFDIYVYDTSFNAVYSTQVSTASLTPVNTGNLSASGGQIYDFNLATSINLGVGSYFLHVGSIDVNPQGDRFVWADSATGNNSFRVNFFDGNGWQTDAGAGDLAFKLTASPAPEPASLCMLALGGLALIRRRTA